MYKAIEGQTGPLADQAAASLAVSSPASSAVKNNSQSNVATNVSIGLTQNNQPIAQAYRTKILKRLGIPAKFIFSNILPANNLEALASNLGLDDDQIIWLYNFFTDVKIAPTTYRLQEFEQQLAPGFTKKVLDGGQRPVRLWGSDG